MAKKRKTQQTRAVCSGYLVRAKMLFHPANRSRESAPTNQRREALTNHAFSTLSTVAFVMTMFQKQKIETALLVKHHLYFLSFSASVEVFLRFLQKEYQWSTNSVKTISSQLAKDDITSVRLLAMCWKETQERFPIGMRKMIDKELRKRDMI